MTRPAAASAGRSVGRAAHRYWYPLVALVRRDVKQRYAATILGLGWTLAQPLALILVYGLVFGGILRVGSDTESRPFALFMLSGMLPYLAVAEGIQRAATALREDRALLDRADFPAVVVPTARVVSASVTEAAGLLVLLAALMLTGRGLTGWVTALPALILLRIVTTCGAAWVVSLLAVFVRDLAEALSLLLTAWLFLTPIFYPASAMPAELGWVLALNPLHHLVEAYRGILLDGDLPVRALGFLAVWAAGMGAGGLWFFNKAIDRGRDFL